MYPRSKSREVWQSIDSLSITLGPDRKITPNSHKTPHDFRKVPHVSELNLTAKFTPWLEGKVKSNWDTRVEGVGGGCSQGAAIGRAPSSSRWAGLPLGALARIPPVE